MREQVVGFNDVGLVAQRGGYELGGHGGLWVGKDLVDAALFHDAAVFHHGDLIGDGAYDFHLVGNNHDGDAKFLVYLTQ